MMGRNKLDSIFAECLERLLSGGEELEQCLADYPEQAAELRPLLETALVASQMKDIMPRPEFRARARHEFQSALRVARPKQGFLPLAWPRWATVVAVVLIMLLAGGSTVASANNSMPDGTLYPVKLFTEQVRLALATSDISRAEIHARLTDRRVTEIKTMVDRNRPEYVEQTVNRLNCSLDEVAILAGGSAELSPVMLAPTPKLEPAPAPSATPAPGPSLAPAPPGEADQDEGAGVRDERLARFKTLVAGYAEKHPSELRAILRTAPETVKPELRRALEITETRYREALEAVGEAEDR